MKEVRSIGTLLVACMLVAPVLHAQTGTTVAEASLLGVGTAIVSHWFEPARCRWCSGPSADTAGEFRSSNARKAADWASSGALAAAFLLNAHVVLHAPGDRNKTERTAHLTRTILLTQALTEVAKVSFARERPDESNAVSMWSGHAATATAALVEAWRQDHHQKVALATALSLSVASGVGRVLAGKHHWSDVAVGAGAGVAIGLVAQ